MEESDTDYDYGPEPDPLNIDDVNNNTQSFLKVIHEPHNINPRFKAFSWSLLAWICVAIIFIVSFIAIKNNGLFCPPPLNNITLIKEAQYLSDANFSSNPCSNFWEYACGGYTSTHINNSVLSEMQIANIAQIEPTLHALLDNYTPLLNYELVLNYTDEQLAQIGWYDGYSIDISPNINKPSEYAIYITQRNISTTNRMYIPLQFNELICATDELLTFLTQHASIPQFMLIDNTEPCDSLLIQERFYDNINQMSITSQLIAFWPNAIGAKFATINNNNLHKIKIQEMCEKLRLSAVDFVKTAWWLDRSSATNAIRKLSSLDFYVGYGNSFSGDCTDDLSTPASFYTCQQKQFSTAISKLTSIPQGDQHWEMTAIEVNAYYTPTFNAIYIPYGIANMPLYHPDLPELMNMVGLGAIIAHEIGHAIDPSGVNFSSTGTRDPWLSPRSKLQMDSLDSCIVDYYNKTGVDDAQLTLNENFADLFSTAILELYVKGYDAQKLWTMWAQTWCRVSTHTAPGPIPKNTDVHAQSRYRVLGTSGQNLNLQHYFYCNVKEEEPCFSPPN